MDAEVTVEAHLDVSGPGKSVVSRHLLADGVAIEGVIQVADFAAPEAPGRELRMTDLANASALSASRMTRLVDALQTRGLVTKRTSPKDGRGNVAKLTP